MASLTLSKVIERPPPNVFRFIITDHVANHPRWDPNMTLEQLTPGPLAAGTVIRRSYRQNDTLVEGEMEVTEYEPDRAASMVIRDGPAEVRSRTTFEPEGKGHTRLVLSLEADVPGGRMDENAIQESLTRMKELIEAEP